MNKEICENIIFDILENNILYENLQSNNILYENPQSNNILYENPQSNENIILDVLEKLTNKKNILENDILYENPQSNENINFIKEKYCNNNLDTKKIDLVYFYVDYNDINYLKKIKIEIDNKYLINNLEINKTILRMIRAELKKEKGSNYDFFVNLELTRKNIEYIGKIYIITPTPFILNNIYDSNIEIISLDKICSNNFYEIYIRPNNILKFINKINGLSDIFFYANSCQSICNKIKKDRIFKNNIPFVHLSIKDLEKDKKKNIKNFEEYNANLLFFEKTGINSKFIGIDKISIIRKDVINMTNAIFENKIEVDFRLLQYLVGNLFNLYYISTHNDSKVSSFLSNIPKNPYEKLNMIKFKMIDYFSLNSIHKNYIPYFLYSHISKKEIQNIYIIGDNLRYIISDIMKNLNEFITNKNVKYIDNVENDIFDETLYILVGNNRKNYNIKNSVIIEIDEKIIKNVIPDILYFMNIKLNKINKKFDDSSEKYVNELIKIHYPSIIIKQIEKETNIPYLKILNMSINKSDESVKNNSIIFECEITPK